MKHIVIAGGGYAGLMSALRLQPQIKRDQARVTLINANPNFTERIRLHQVAAGQILMQHRISDFLCGTRVEFVQDVVREIKPNTQELRLSERSMSYDTLVVALGSQVDQDAIPGIRDHAYTLDPYSAQQLRTRLAKGGRLLVIGGGLTGIEAATEFAEQVGVDVHLATRGALGAVLSRKGRDHLLQRLSALSITLHEHLDITAIEADHASSNRSDLAFDLCLWAGGFKASPLIAEAGFAVNEQGQMIVRETLQARDYDNIYGVGDAALIKMEAGQGLRMACAVGMPMGVHAANNIANDLSNKRLEPFQFSYMLQCISLGRQDALVQFVQSDNQPKQSIVTGRIGAVIKEAICRYTIFSLRLEQRWPGSYRYPKGLQARQTTVYDAQPQM